MGKIIKTVIRKGDKPTAKQIKMIEDASRRPIVFDDDSPEFSYEEMLEMIEKTKKMRVDTRKQVVTLRLSTPAVNKAKAVGKGYTSFLSRLVENALNDKELVAKSL
ncbi:hypothetical protein IKF94_03835 [Candidatus Saccharibacteria bacterium]|nr:hypothetical protein [Candidatus Saccharibacteria bacterium]